MVEKIIGVIFPIPPEYIDRLLVENRNVFAKYLARNGSRLLPKQKMLFYVSHSSKKITGEGQIDEILFLTPDEALVKYEKKLFLNRDELMAYARRQPKRSISKRMLVVVLSRLKIYPKPVSYRRPISMAGQYLTKEDYEELLSLAQLKAKD